MKPGMYEMHLKAAWGQAFVLELLPVQEMLEAAEHADTVGAVLDPTLYRDRATTLHEDIRLLRALRHVQLELAKMKGRLPL